MFDRLKEISDQINDNCDGLGIKNKRNPVSITQSEFNYITKYIIDNNLKSGFECATAFGVSACAAGLGFQQTGGHLITMDCYIEESTEDCSAYSIQDSSTFKASEPLGLKICKSLLGGLKIECVTPIIGVSPMNIPPGTYDYVFIDAEHTLDAIKRDLIGIKPFLAEKYSVFIHDLHCFPKIEEFVAANFECDVQCNVANSKYQLSLFRNF